MISKSNPLYIKADLLAKTAYSFSQNFPKTEIYGLTSQLRRASMSVILNIIEGFARQSPNEFRRFLLISFGSLEETRYILEFACGQNYISKDNYDKIIMIVNEIAKIIWSVIHPKNK